MVSWSPPLPFDFRGQRRPDRTPKRWRRCGRERETMWGIGGVGADDLSKMEQKWWVPRKWTIVVRILVLLERGSQPNVV